MMTMITHLIYECV